MEVNKEKIRYILQFLFDKGENASQAAVIVNGVYGANTVTANYTQFWFRRLMHLAQVGSSLKISIKSRQ